MGDALPCPDVENLLAFLLGQMTDAQADELERHVLGCDRCAAALDGLATRDQLVLPLRARAPAAPAGEAVENLIARLAKEGPPTTSGAGPGPGPATPLPAQFGDYRLVREIGRGGMGVVYEAEQLSLRRRVALKVFPFAAAFAPHQLQRFRNEPQVAAQFQHENIVPVYAVGCEQGTHYYVMQYVEGRSLDKVIRQLRRVAGKRPRGRARPGATVPAAATSRAGDRAADEGREGSPAGAAGGASGAPAEAAAGGPDYFRAVARIGVQAAEALEHAHGRGVVHRDVKPGNLILDRRDHLWVTDFGLAHFCNEAPLTATGDLLGTLRYMSPEQALARPGYVDHRSDVYSLGATLYELLTLEPVFPGPSKREFLEQILFAEPRAPRRLSPDVPPDLEVIVLKALEKAPAERYATARELADDLRRFLEHRPIRARRPALWQRARKWARRHEGVAATLAAASALAAVILALSTWLISRQRDRAEKAEASLLQEEGELREQRDRAVAQRRRAEAAEVEARRRFYAAQMNLAAQAQESGNPARVLALLEGQRPAPGEEDFRGFEWYYLWRLCHAGRRYTLNLPALSPSHVAFSPDGKTLAASGKPWAVRRWDAATGRERRALGANVAAVQCMAFARDGKTVVTGSLHGPITLQAWEVETGRERGPASGRREEVWSVALSPDGKDVAVGGVAGAPIKVYRLATWKERHTLAGHATLVCSVAFAPDGKTLATASGWGDGGGLVRLWDLARQPPAVRRELPGAMCVAFSPDGKTLATAGEGGAVKTYDVASGREGGSFKGHVGLVCSVAFGPDGRTLVSGGCDRTVRLWDVRAPGQRTCYADTGPVYAVAFSPGGKAVASIGPERAIKVWDVAPPPEEVVLPHAGILAAFSPDGRTLATTGGTPAKLWEVTAWKQPSRGPQAAGPTPPPAARPPLSFDESTVPADSPVFSHDGKTLAAALGRTIKLYDVDTRRERATLEGPTTFWGLAFSPDDQSLASASNWPSTTVEVWDLATRRVRARVTPTSAGSTRAVAFSPDGKTLATGSQFGVVKLWDAATGRERATLRPAVTDGMVWVFSVAFSPSGKVLAAADRQGEVRLWDLETGALRAVLEGHTDAVVCLAFSPDGHTLATGGDDATVKLWDVATGQEKITLKGHEAPVRSVAFDRYGALLAAGSTDGTVRLWRAAIDPEALARRVGVGPGAGSGDP